MKPTILILLLSLSTALAIRDPGAIVTNTATAALFRTHYEVSP